jgi:hypothetical protein
MTRKQSKYCLILLLPFASNAQHKTTHTNMLWEGYYNTMNFNKTWSLLSDAQIRTRDWTKQWSQILVRSGLNYKINDHTAVTAGFAFFKNAQYSNKELFLKNEWRPWQEFSYQVKLHKINFSQRLRTEQRFLQQVVNNEKANDYQYIFRLRYRFEFQMPLKENNIIILAGNEVLVNPEYLNNSLFFDQNRAFAGLNCKVNSNSTFQFQYVKIFQWHSNTSVLDDQNVFRINLLQQFNLRKSHDSK